MPAATQTITYDHQTGARTHFDERASCSLPYTSNERKNVSYVCSHNLLFQYVEYKSFRLKSGDYFKSGSSRLKQLIKLERAGIFLGECEKRLADFYTGFIVSTPLVNLPLCCNVSSCINTVITLVRTVRCLLRGRLPHPQLGRTKWIVLIII